jgi:hypothetical protein
MHTQKLTGKCKIMSCTLLMSAVIQCTALVPICHGLEDSRKLRVHFQATTKCICYVFVLFCKGTLADANGLTW